MVTLAPSSTPLVALVVLAALCMLRWRRPGWSRRLARRLRPAAAGAAAGAILLVAFALGLALDPLAPRGLTRAFSGQVVPALAPFGAWFAAPDFPRDLALLALLAAVIAADGRPRRARRWSSWSSSRQVAAQVWAQVRTRAPGALAFTLPLSLLLLAWIDVLGSVLGVHAARLYERLAGAGWLAWHPAAGLAPEPDLRLLALYWWLAASAMAAGDRQRLGARVALWPIVPLLGALLGVVARPLAGALALPTFLGVAVLASALAYRPQVAWTNARRPSAILERAALLGTLGLALALRWTPLILGPPASDTFGYFETARTFYQRVAEAGTNPIALAYLNLHPAAREPLFPLVLRAAFDVLGDSLVHQRYVTIALAVLGVYLTYRFGRACFGPVVGLLAALVVAVLPWQVMVSQEGLREELGMAAVYGLAILVVTRPGPQRSQTDSQATVHWPAAAAGGALAAAAVLTRLDAGAVVLALLLAWTLRHGRAWRATLPAWIVSGALVAPLLAGYVLRAGDALTPLGGNMGGDIQAAVAPLVRREQPLAEVLRAFAVGTYEVYGNTIYGNAAGWLPAPVRPVAVGLALVATAAGLAMLIARGPRLPALLAVLGVFVPPFTYLAGISVTRGPGGGYTERYAYLILPATLAVCAWVVVRTLSWVLAAAGSRARRYRPLGASRPPVVAAPDSA